MTTPTSLTDSQRKALLILRDHRVRGGRDLAERLWPDSPGWRKVCKCGAHNASTMGGGMNISGGAYLGKLRALGLAEYTADEWDMPLHLPTALGLRLLALTGTTEERRAYAASHYVGGFPDFSVLDDTDATRDGDGLTERDREMDIYYDFLEKNR